MTPQAKLDVCRYDPFRDRKRTAVIPRRNFGVRQTTGSDLLLQAYGRRCREENKTAFRFAGGLCCEAKHRIIMVRKRIQLIDHDQIKRMIEPQQLMGCG
ncbi:hypothetical protein D3C81_1611740 [compost metagenome]